MSERPPGASEEREGREKFLNAFNLLFRVKRLACCE
jgi:hypothetical protein